MENATARGVSKVSENGVWTAVWSVHAPWAHPHWTDYVVFLVDLTVETEIPAIKYLEEATHEVQVWVWNPQYDVIDFTEDAATWSFNFLHPMNHGYQFEASSDQAAFNRVDSIVEAIDRREVSPDTDYSRQWDSLFSDGVSLRQIEPVQNGQKGRNNG